MEGGACLDIGFDPREVGDREAERRDLHVDVWRLRKAEVHEPVEVLVTHWGGEEAEGVIVLAAPRTGRCGQQSFRG